MIFPWFLCPPLPDQFLCYLRDWIPRLPSLTCNLIMEAGVVLTVAPESPGLEKEQSYKKEYKLHIHSRFQIFTEMCHLLIKCWTWEFYGFQVICSYFQGGFEVKLEACSLGTTALSWNYFVKFLNPETWKASVSSSPSPSSFYARNPFSSFHFVFHSQDNEKKRKRESRILL